MNLFRKKTGMEQYKRFENIIQYSKELIDKTKDDSEKRNSIFSIIKLLADKITNDNVLEVIQTNRTLCDSHRLLTVDSLLVEEDKTLRYLQMITEQDIINEFKIDLGLDPVITTVWNKSRLLGAISDIGIPSNEWKEQRFNHYVDLFLPIGLCIVHNGFHSTYSGIIKTKGAFEFNNECNHHIYSLCPLYDLMFFDGVHYKMCKDKRIIGRGLNFEFGCVYEIGRIILENKISYLDSKKP